MKLLEQNPAITHDKPNKNVFQWFNVYEFFILLPSNMLMYNVQSAVVHLFQIILIK